MSSSDGRGKGDNRKNGAVCVDKRRKTEVEKGKIMGT